MKLITRADNILNVVKPLRSINEEGVFVFRPESIEVKLTDPAHVAMFRTYTDMRTAIKEGSVRDYKINGEEEKLGVDLEKLVDALKFIGSEEVTVYDEIPTLPNGKKGIHRRLVLEGISLRRSISLLHPESMGEPKVPKLTEYAVFDLSCATLKKRMQYMKGISDSCAIEYERGKVTLSAEGDEDEVVFNEYVTHSPSVGDSKVRSKFPLDYLTNGFKALTPTSESGYKVTLKLGNDYPLVVEYSRGNTDFKFLIAPRIEHD